ncbi:MAG: metalloregulator ArsR/SmtB family transcription factor [Thermodesulfobacteriota bacterium]|nr:MAG: metalloregulator ArsR/SmtB family transcription factor [Thermodesulfobacteriota bacterium]
MQSEICKTLSNPKRLEIIYVLKDGEKSAGEITAEMGLAKANVSQHLSVLKSCGVVRSRRDGVNIHYSITNPKIVRACALMREVLMEQIEERRDLMKGFSGTGRGLPKRKKISRR